MISITVVVASQLSLCPSTFRDFQGFQIELLFFSEVYDRGVVRQEWLGFWAGVFVKLEIRN